VTQLDLFTAAADAAGQCESVQPESYGPFLPDGKPEVRPAVRCPEVATHRAGWWKADGRSGGIDCCLRHANYYACAWFAPCLLYPAVTDWVTVTPLTRDGRPVERRSPGGRSA
jgi:hypothetical protein